MRIIEQADTIPDFMKKAVPWGKGREADEFEVGMTLPHHWGRTINAGENSLFTTLSQMYNPIYFNELYAREQGHDGIVINPFLVFNIIFGLSVEELSENRSVFLGIDECKFHETVYAGDTLRAESKVLATRNSTSNARNKIVTWRTSGFNQNDTLVIEYIRSNIFIEGLMGDQE